MHSDTQGDTRNDLQHRLSATDAADNQRRVAQLEDEIAELSAHIDAATARLLSAIAEFDRRQGWRDGFVSCAHWLSYRVGLTLVTAREKVRVARALEHLPGMVAALARGRISYSKVRELTRIATPENEEELVELALAGTASQVQRIVRAFRGSEQAELPRAERQREGSYLALRTDDDGMLVVEGRLPPEVGALLKRALGAAELDLGRRAGTNDASAEASDAAAAGTPGQRRADALGLVAERALSRGRSERCDANQVMLHVDAAVLSGQQTEGGRCHLEGGPALAAETARRLSCDASVVTLVEGRDGQPLDVGRKTRRVSTALFRALKARDRTCQFPGCDKAGALTPHHIAHWAAGGTTNRDNLCLLCAAHHWAVHEGGYEVRGRAQAAEGSGAAGTRGALTFYTPAGIELQARPAPPQLPAEPVSALMALHVAEGLEISAQSNVIWWQGERWDLDWAVESLWSRKEAGRRGHAS